MVTPRENSCLRYCKSTIFQANHNQAVVDNFVGGVVCDTAKVRFFKQITTIQYNRARATLLFAILQKYDFSSKSQPVKPSNNERSSCLRYCKSTIFQANHNGLAEMFKDRDVVCDTAKVRFFKQITTRVEVFHQCDCCLRYCKSTIFQANHNRLYKLVDIRLVVCDTAKVRFFKQITTRLEIDPIINMLFAILQKYDFSSKSQLLTNLGVRGFVVCDTAKVRFFKQITTPTTAVKHQHRLFAILQKYDFSSKSQPFHFC